MLSVKTMKVTLFLLGHPHFINYITRMFVFIHFKS